MGTSLKRTVALSLVLLLISSMPAVLVRESVVGDFSQAGTSLLDDDLADFEIEIIDHTENVTVGDEVEIEYRVENLGGESDIQSIDLYVDGEKEKSVYEQVLLNPGDSLHGTVEWHALVEEGEYEIRLESEDHKDSLNISVDVREEAYFSVDLLEPREGDGFLRGSEIVVEYEIFNHGGAEEEQNITLQVEGEEKCVETVTLEGREKHTGEFTLELKDEGEHELSVSSDDDQQEVKIGVTEDPRVYSWILLVVVAAVGIIALLGVYKKKR